jgi:hypothetical protein
VCFVVERWEVGMIEVKHGENAEGEVKSKEKKKK